MKSKSHYRDKDAQIHQEVVTPPELMERILQFIKDDDINGKDVLDPCVGPGAMIIPIIENYHPKSITVCDIQKLHIDNFIKYCKGRGCDVTNVVNEYISDDSILELW